MRTPALNEALDALLTYGESDLARRARAELEALRREAINDALEEAANEIRMAALDHSGPGNDVFCEGMRAAAAVVAEMKKEA